MRTEEDKLLQAPIEVTLGGKQYQVKPLVIRDAREWRKKLLALLSSLPGYAKENADFTSALSGMLVELPDQAADLFFAYAKDLNREEIEGAATEAELAGAFDQVMEVALPLVGKLTGTLGKVAR
jgi:hypothetical protein